MKKKKLFVRIVAAILVAVTALGLVVSVVMATEVDPNTTQVTTQPTEESVVIEPANIPSLQLVDLPDGFDQPVVTVFIGNIETQKVQYVNLYQKDGYAAAVNLADGYYIVYANGYAWSDKNGNAYAISGGIYSYMCLGDNYSLNQYGVKFDTTKNGIFGLVLSAAPDSFRRIKYKDNLVVAQSDLHYPEDAKLANDVDDENTSTEQNAHSENEDRVTFFDMIWDMIKDSAILLILLIVSAFAYNVIKIKKQMAIEKQTENDKYDDQHIE